MWGFSGFWVNPRNRYFNKHITQCDTETVHGLEYALGNMSGWFVLYLVLCLNPKEEKKIQVYAILGRT